MINVEPEEELLPKKTDELKVYNLRLTKKGERQNFGKKKMSVHTNQDDYKITKQTTYKDEENSDLTRHQLYEIVVHEKSVRVHETYADITSTVFLIEPRNIFYNMTDKIVEIRQGSLKNIPEDITEKLLTVEPYERIPFFWHDGSVLSKKVDLQFRTIPTDLNTINSKELRSEIPWSGNMNIEAYGINTIMGKEKVKSKKKEPKIKNRYFQYEVKKLDGLRFVYLKRLSKIETHIKIENRCSDVKVSCWQKDCSMEKVFYLGPRQWSKFAWIDTRMKRTIIIELTDASDNTHKPVKHEFDLDFTSSKCKF